MIGKSIVLIIRVFWYVSLALALGLCVSHVAHCQDFVGPTKRVIKFVASPTVGLGAYDFGMRAYDAHLTNYALSFHGEYHENIMPKFVQTPARMYAADLLIATVNVAAYIYTKRKHPKLAAVLLASDGTSVLCTNIHSKLMLAEDGH